MRHASRARVRIVMGFAAGLLVTGGVVACGGSTTTTSGDGGTPPPGVPDQHRPTAPTCETTRAPGYNSDAGAPDSGAMTCAKDADCTQGRNGRCQSSRLGFTCNYDQCVTDGDCTGGAVCECGTPSGTYGRGPNVCLKATCRVDSDCGSGGYCSPSYSSTCGKYGGYVGYYCRTSKDECTHDSDCKADGSPNGLCVWTPERSLWACTYSACAG